MTAASKGFTPDAIAKPLTSHANTIAAWSTALHQRNAFGILARWMNFTISLHSLPSIFTNNQLKHF